MVVPSLCSSVSNSITSRPFLESRLPVGSSARINFGPDTTARAIATRCCCPPDNCCGKCLAQCVIPIRSMAASTFRLRSAEGTPKYSKGSSMFSNTFSSSIKLKLWNTKPITPLRKEVRCDSV